ncbi:MAG TPA: hypothetical protein VGR96_07365 [Acidobacteriaceae bacterium]|nr:hypothetical protein [Acidobacteriaceae bacterium]
MLLSGAQPLELSLAAAGALALLVALRSRGRKPKQIPEGWQFPVRIPCVLFHSLGLVVGLAGVAYAGRRLLIAGISQWSGWVCFGLGFTLVLLVLLEWPEPLILDGHGLLERGSASSRIRWEELSHVRRYQIRHDRGIVIHSVYGKQLVVPEMRYDSTRVLDALLQAKPVSVRDVEGETGPLPIVTVPLQRH